MNQRDVLKHLQAVAAFYWPELTDKGRYLMVRAKRSLERDVMASENTSEIPCKTS